MRGLYEEHIAACRLTAAYEHRRRTLPAAAAAGDQPTWEAEAYRWIGAELTFTPTAAYW